MDMTLDSYISNPLGKNNAIITHIARQAMKDDYVNGAEFLFRTILQVI